MLHIQEFESDFCPLANTILWMERPRKPTNKTSVRTERLEASIHPE
jgi:hypothetical protein